MDRKNILNELPMGFSMSLARDLTALNRFSNLPQKEQEEIVNKARNIRSKQEMTLLVSSLSVSG